MLELLGLFPGVDVICDAIGNCCDDDVIVNCGSEGVLKLIPEERLLALLCPKEEFLFGDDNRPLFPFILFIVVPLLLVVGASERYFFGFSRET